MQNIIVLFIIIVCAFIIGKRFWKSLQPGAKSSCGCSCSCCDNNDSSKSCEQPPEANHPSKEKTDTNNAKFK